MDLHQDKPMPIENLNDEWHVIRVCLKWKWPAITRRDLAETPCSEEELLDVLESRTGETRENLRETINTYRSVLNLPQNPAPATDRMDRQLRA